MIARARILLGTFHDDAFQAVGKVRHFHCRGRNLLLQMLERHGHRGIPVKGHMSGHHLVHGDADGIDVALLVHDAASRLLRRRVMHRAHHARADGLGGCGGAGDAEIRHFHLAVFGYDDVLRFDIPVDNMVVMGSLKPRHHLDGDADGLFRRYPALFLDIIFQRDALYQLHDHVVEPSVLTDIVYVHDIGMHQSCRCLGLA